MADNALVAHMANDVVIICWAKQRKETKLQCGEGEWGQKMGAAALMERENVSSAEPLLLLICFLLSQVTGWSEEQKSSACMWTECSNSWNRG